MGGQGYTLVKGTGALVGAVTDTRIPDNAFRSMRDS